MLKIPLLHGRRASVAAFVVVVGLSLSLLMIPLTATAHAGRTAARSRILPTIFGRGPEIHLSRDWGPIGSKVLVVGRGYPPGRVVDVVPGGPNAEWLNDVLAHARVSSRGTFRTTVHVTCNLIYVDFFHKHPRTRCAVPKSSNGLFFMFLLAMPNWLGTKPPRPSEWTGFTVTTFH